MRGRFFWITLALLAMWLLFSLNRAHAVIKAETPLKAIEGAAVYIVVGKVEKFFPDKPAMLVTVTEDIKGNAPFRKLPINCKVADEKTFKENLIGQVLKRVGPDLEVIFFLTPRGKSYITFAFTNGTWFQLQGSKVDKDQAVFSLKSGEPYFHKSFQGTTAELRKLLKDHAAGKAKLPPINDKVKPGFGPEYQPKKSAAADPQESLRSSWGFAGYQTGGSLFAVIPTLGIGAPLAILAILFPTVFGGVFVLFRQWLAFITAISLNSTLMLVHYFFTAKYFRGGFLGNDADLWLVMTAVTLGCLFWAWRRQLDLLAAGEREASRRTELLILLVMSVSTLAATLVTWRLADRISWSDANWTLMIVLSVGIVAGTLYRGYHAFKSEPLFGAPLATEGVILATLTLGHLVFIPAIWGSNFSTEGVVDVNENASRSTAKITPAAKPTWVFTVEPRIKGMYASSPILDGDALYASFSETTQYATLVRLDRQTGMKKWEFFGKNDDLRQMISTPCIDDGKLYFGEGFHDDKNCHVFCVDAERGEELWRFKTAGQTESSPTVAHGMLYIGAGNDGIYSLDVAKSLAAKKGIVAWKYPPASGKPPAAGNRLQRFGGGMLVVGKRLYCGTGVDRNQAVDKGETAVFCFNADTGEMIWKAPAPYPVWSKPVVKDGLVYVTSGNGDVFDDAKEPDKPGGALQCLDEQTGKEKWRITVGNGIIESPAIDAHHIYFGSRDQHVYCVNRADGKERWKYFLQSPVIASPVLDTDPVYERTVSVFVISSTGKVCCMNPQSGDIVWNYDLTGQLAYTYTVPRLVVTRTPTGYRRQLYFGCGLGGGPRDFASNRPVLYCLEDLLSAD